MAKPTLTARIETWPLREAFVISRGAKTEARVVVAEISDGAHTGRGECVPYARYGETVEGVLADIETFAARSGSSLDLVSLQEKMPSGAARNAVDCALWDYTAKHTGRRVTDMIGDRTADASPPPITTCFTLSLGTPDDMAAKARAAQRFPLLKLKLGGAGDAERMHAVRAARPDARLVADANEAWTEALLPELMSAAQAARLELVEQPLPADADEALRAITRAVPVCADESVHTIEDLPRLATLYDAINIKLDKTGGLTGALELERAARAAGMKVMVGCMVATSLAMAPALLLAQGARWVDLDGPLLLARDREHGLGIENGIIQPPSRALWG